MSGEFGNNIAIPAFMKIESNAFQYFLDCMLENHLDNPVVYFGNGIEAVLGEKINLLSSDRLKWVKGGEFNSINMEDLVQEAFGLPHGVDCIVAIGGGKVIDAGKYIAFLKNLPFISIPTSGSNDGFASETASILIQGKRVSVPAKTPYGIMIDTDLLKTAPDSFLYSGIGDMVSKITACYDWVFETRHGVGEMNDYAMMISKKSVNSFVRIPFEDIHEDFFISELINSLALSGVANEIAGNSSPTSGSEHLISHALDSFLENPQLHGIQVGVATYLMSLVHNHRYERVRTFLTDTGFFDYAAKCGMRKADFKTAIDLAPDMKPFRYTYLHEEKYRKMAKELLDSDEILNRILV